MAVSSFSRSPTDVEEGKQPITPLTLMTKSSATRKWYCTSVIALTCFAVAFDTAVITADIESVAAEFHASEEVSLLTIILFVVGFGTEERGVPTAFFSAAPFVGPTMGSLVGGFILCGQGLALAVLDPAHHNGHMLAAHNLQLPENYGPALLLERAKALLGSTSNDTHKTEAEVHARPFREMYRICLTRFLLLLFREPIVLLLSVYMSILYSYSTSSASPIRSPSGSVNLRPPHSQA
ncbi:MAG: hypothetical protein MMC23_003826 [Stictis urceolatum]|nr:hypothetical protein [Stictis urceolata]